MWPQGFLLTFVIVVVTVVWATVWIASLLTPVPDAPDPTFNLIMGAVVGAVGGTGAWARWRDLNGKNDDG